MDSALDEQHLYSMDQQGLYFEICKQEKSAKKEKEILDALKQDIELLNYDDLKDLKKYSGELVEKARRNGTLKGKWEKSGVLDSIKSCLVGLVCNKKEMDVELSTNNRGNSAELLAIKFEEGTESPRTKEQLAVTPASNQERAESNEKNPGFTTVSPVLSLNQAESNEKRTEGMTEGNKNYDVVFYGDPISKTDIEKCEEKLSKVRSAFDIPDFQERMARLRAVEYSETSQHLGLKQYAIDRKACAPAATPALAIEFSSEVSISLDHEPPTVQEDSQTKRYNFVQDDTAFQEELAEKRKIHEEKMEKLQKEIEDCERETVEIEERSEQRRQALNQAFFSRLAAEKRFEEEENNCEEFINSLQEHTVNAKMRFGLFEKSLRTIKKKDLEEVLEAELPSVRNSTLKAYKAVYQGWITVKNLCGKFPDKMFLFIIQRELVAVCGKLCAILTELDSLIDRKQESIENLCRCFSALDPVDISGTARLQEQAETEPEETLKFDGKPEFYEELTRPEIEEVPETDLQETHV